MPTTVSLLTLLDAYQDMRKGLGVPEGLQLVVRPPPSRPYTVASMAAISVQPEEDLVQVIRRSLEGGVLRPQLDAAGVVLVDHEPTGFPFVPWSRLVDPNWSPQRMDGKSRGLLPSAVVNRLCIAQDPQTLTLQAPAHLAGCPAAFHLPRRSAFLLADLSSWHSHLRLLPADCRPLDVVLLDPPWPNRSAARSVSYTDIDIYELFKLDLDRLLRDLNGDAGCLVAVWVTNWPKARRFVLDKLFRDWNIQVVADQWLWLKVAQNGEPVFDLGNTGRRCYENLIIGQWGKGTSYLPRAKVFASVPLGHSRKPNVLPLLRPHLARPDAPNVLECFSRASMAGVGLGWHVSVGNEALKFNQLEGWLRPA